MTVELTLEGLIASQEVMIQSTKGRLLEKMVWVRDQLNKAIVDLRDEDRVANSLGLLQASGPDIDRMMGTLATQKGVLDQTKLYVSWALNDLKKEREEHCN